MRKEVCYIADHNGSVEFLNQAQQGDVLDLRYETFYSSIDTVVMGFKTFHQITTELSLDSYPYADIESFVLTHRILESMPSVNFVDTSYVELIQTLKKQEGKDIWICGGASVINPLINSGLIDVFGITIAPILLGTGIRLFHKGFKPYPLTFISSITVNELTTLKYKKADS